MRLAGRPLTNPSPIRGTARTGRYIPPPTVIKGGLNGRLLKKTNHGDCCRVHGDIRYCATDHTYLHVPSNQQLTSVSHLTQVVYSTKSWDGVDPAIVENARRRGEAIDKYMADYVRYRTVTVSDESSDVVDRLILAHRLWESLFGGRPAEVQKIVFNLDDGIAGTMDFYVEPSIVVDLKCTYYSETAWILQLGAYAEYSNAERCGIIHVSPKVYREGARWLEYDPVLCREYFRKAVAWWKETKAMEKYR